MYWDVVEVKPEPDYSLFVRFEDGLSGRARFSEEHLTRALAPLRDPRFFNQVFIDCGAVTWPGNIDVAPDAMYEDVANGRYAQEATEGMATREQKRTSH